MKINEKIQLRRLKRACLASKRCRTSLIRLLSACSRSPHSPSLCSSRTMSAATPVLQQMQLDGTVARQPCPYILTPPSPSCWWMWLWTRESVSCWPVALMASLHPKSPGPSTTTSFQVCSKTPLTRNVLYDLKNLAALHVIYYAKNCILPIVSNYLLLML